MTSLHETFLWNVVANFFEMATHETSLRDEKNVITLVFKIFFEK